MKNIYNLETLVSVRIKDKSPCPYLTYLPYKKSFWWGTQLEGFHGHNFLDGGVYTAEELRHGKFCGVPLIVEGYNVYYRPEVTLTFIGKDLNASKGFGTYEEALAFGQAQVKAGINVALEL